MSDTAIFLDVDGVINHLGWKTPYLSNGSNAFKDVRAGGYTVRVPNFMPSLIRHLVENYEVYWLTTWRENANEFISPILGIPQTLPVITDGTTERRVSWKPAAARPIARHLIERGKRVIWIEDFNGMIPSDMGGVEFIDTGFHDGLFPFHVKELIGQELYEDFIARDFGETPRYEPIGYEPEVSPFYKVEWDIDDTGNDYPLETEKVWRADVQGFKMTVVQISDRFFGFLELPSGNVMEYPSFESFDEAALELQADAHLESMILEDHAWN